MKKLVLATILNAIVIAPAMAMQESVAHLDDAQLIFQKDRQPLELALLSKQEMKETEGAVVPPVVIGAAIGAGGNTVMYVYNNRGQITWQGAAYAAGTGALVGAGGAALIGASGGGIAAQVAWRPNMIAANYSLSQMGKGLSSPKPGLACTGRGPCILSVTGKRI